LNFGCPASLGVLTRSLIIFALLACAQPALAQHTTLVRTPAQYEKALSSAASGDTIVLANGSGRSARSGITAGLTPTDVQVEFYDQPRQRRARTRRTRL